MAEKISSSKGFDDTTFDTYVPELEEAADIRNALELFFYGDSTDGNTTGDVSLHATIVDFDTRISANDAAFDGHTGAISDVHGVGAGNLVVGTGTVQTLTNKTLTSPTIASPSISSPNVTGTATLPSTTSIGNVSSTEISYLDGVTSSIQTQINTNTPTGMISIHSGSVAPTGWLLCDGTSYGSAAYTTLFNVIGYTFGGSGANFNVPNLKGKVVVGIDGSQVEFDTRGETGGAMTHQHATSTSGGASAGNTTGGASAGNTTGGASTGNTTNGASDGNTTSTAGSHSHTVDPGAITTNSNGDHDHNGTTGIPSSNVSVPTGTTGGGRASVNHTHDFNTGNSGNHSHSFDIASFNSGNHDGHSHTTTDHTHTTTDHTHTTTDHSHTTVDHNHAVSASDIISNLQPYIALNYIIKI
jgi:microcystin-dependent protein